MQVWVAQHAGPSLPGSSNPVASATDDKRLEFQRMIERTCDGESVFNVIVAHSVSRLFRDAFGLEFYSIRSSVWMPWVSSTPPPSRASVPRPGSHAPP